jgi:hypothetical protein
MLIYVADTEDSGKMIVRCKYLHCCFYHYIEPVSFRSFIYTVSDFITLSSHSSAI